MTEHKGEVAVSRIFMLMHEPGPMVDRVQSCVRCGEIISDYRNAAVAVRPGHPEDAVIAGWAEGKPILRTPDGGYTERYEGDSPDVDWAYCTADNSPFGSKRESND